MQMEPTCDVWLALSLAFVLLIKVLVPPFHAISQPFLQATCVYTYVLSKEPDRVVSCIAVLAEGD